MNDHKQYHRLSVEQRVKLVVTMNSRKGTAIDAAKELKVSRQAIYDEIKHHLIYPDVVKVGTYACCFSKTCHLNQNRIAACHNINCERYQPVTCPTLKKFPFVCNKCPKHNFVCIFEKRFYNPSDAHDEAVLIRKEARFKKFDDDSLVSHIDSLISPSIKNGNSLNHTLSALNQPLPVCSRTIRRWIYQGALSCRKHHLPMWAAYQKKADTPPISRTHVKNFEVIAYRMYPAFIRLMTANPSLHHVETDTVVGKPTDKKALITIHFPSMNFMFGFLYAKGSPRSFLYHWSTLRSLLGDSLFYELFPVILCDNGTETSSFYHLEFSALDGVQKGKVFYCDPYASTQKASIERNHAFIRRVIPKGKSFDDPEITDAFIRHMFSHINAIPRAKFNNKTPYALFKDKYGVSLLDKLGIYFVDPLKVDLRAAREFR